MRRRERNAWLVPAACAALAGCRLDHCGTAELTPAWRTDRGVVAWGPVVGPAGPGAVVTPAAGVPAAGPLPAPARPAPAPAPKGWPDDEGAEVEVPRLIEVPNHPTGRNRLPRAEMPEGRAVPGGAPDEPERVPELTPAEPLDAPAARPGGRAS